MITFDTELLPPPLRAQAWIEARAEASVPSTVELADPGNFRGRYEHWYLRNVSVARHTVNSGQRLYRTQGQVDISAPANISITLQEFGIGLHQQFGVCRAVQPGRLVCTDLTAPWEYSFADAGSARALVIALDDLDMEPGTIRAGVERLEFSPINDFVTRQIGEVFDQLKSDSGERETADLGAGTVELIRALLLSASVRPNGTSIERDNRALITQAKAFAERHLAEADLTPARIAEGLGISAEALQHACLGARLMLTTWIADRRLERISDDLAFWGGTHNVAAVAERWGVANYADLRRQGDSR